MNTDEHGYKNDKKPWHDDQLSAPFVLSGVSSAAFLSVCSVVDLPSWMHRKSTLNQPLIIM